MKNTLEDAMQLLGDGRSIRHTTDARRAIKEVSTVLKSELAQGRCALDLLGSDSLAETQKALRKFRVPTIPIDRLTETQLMEWRTLMFEHKTVCDKLRAFAVKMATTKNWYIIDEGRGVVSY